MLKPTKNLILEWKKQKRSKSLLFLDNVKIIEDAIKNSSIEVQCFITSLDELPFQSDKPCYHVDNKTLESLADTITPQKVLCIAYYTQDVVVVPKNNFLVLDHLQDPGNVGTLIRTAKACGFSAVFLIDSVNKTNSKLIRSSVGAVFNQKTYEMTTSEFVSFAKDNNLKLAKCDMDGENVFTYKPNGVVGIVVGNEGQGVCDEISSLCADTIKIPMKEGIESLNAGVSGSIIMYELSKNNF